MSSFSWLSGLHCTECGAKYEAGRLINVCTVDTCRGPLFADYAIRSLDRRRAGDRRRDMWKWNEMLPVSRPERIASLGEGGTPLLHAERLGSLIGMKRMHVKDEAGNPTGSFKARGMSTAVSRAWELGARALAVPTAGNAGGALAAYAARIGMPAHVFMPADTPKVFRQECEAYGAAVTMVDGLIDACGRMVAERCAAEGWFDVSTLKEPYRVEGKKTMGYELVENLHGELPDVIVYPTGGGTGLIGMWKAFDEMQKLSWIGEKRPRMIAVQATGCAPVVKAFAAGAKTMEKWEKATTYASGLRVPKPYADALILRILRESMGEAVAVSDDEIRRGWKELAEREGIFAAPEGGAAWAAVRKLVAAKKIAPDERVVVFNTGSGYKYVE